MLSLNTESHTFINVYLNVFLLLFCFVLFVFSLYSNGKLIFFTFLKRERHRERERERKKNLIGIELDFLTILTIVALIWFLAHKL